MCAQARPWVGGDAMNIDVLPAGAKADDEEADRTTVTVDRTTVTRIFTDENGTVHECSGTEPGSSSKVFPQIYAENHIFDWEPASVNAPLSDTGSRSSAARRLRASGQPASALLVQRADGDEGC